MPSSRAPRLIPLLALIGLALLCGPHPLGHGDEFELEDGRRIEGTVLRELGDFVTIKKTDGKIETLRRSQIKSQRKTKTAFDDYLAKKQKIEDAEKKGVKNAEAHFELAQWCGANKLEAQKTFHLTRTITLNPAHVGARAALGFELIGGEWLKKGSAEATRRKKDLETPLKGKPREIPDDVAKRKPRRPTPPADLTPKADSEAVQFRFDESLNGDKPDHSLAYYRVRDLLRDMKQPMHFKGEIAKDTELADGYFLDVKVRVFFVRVHKFYTKPISNVFRGEAQATLYRVEGGKKTKVTALPQFKVPFSASLDLEKEDAYGYAYYDTVHTLLSKLSKNSFFKKRGAKPYEFGEE